MAELRVRCCQADRELQLLVHFVAQLSSCSVSYDVVQSGTPQLATDSSILAEGHQAVSRCLVGHCQPNSRQAVCLLGDGAFQGAAVWQWCDFAQQLKSAQSKLPLLQQVSRRLESRSFIATNSFSLADLWLYAVCYHVVASSNFSFGGLEPLSRWLEQVHNTAGIRGVYPDLALQRV